MLRDRTRAGQRLAEQLRGQGLAADVVLAVARGRLPVARAVADALGGRWTSWWAGRWAPPAGLMAVGQFYQAFGQETDDQARGCLAPGGAG